MIEILKAILFGIVEGITEWLPISSTGHMILLNEIVSLNVSDEFYSMFEVVIQLGAILAVVILFWNQIWPFGKKDNKGGYRYNVCGVIRDYRSLSALATPLSDSHGAVMILDPQGYIIRQIVKIQGDRAEALAAIRRTCREVSKEVIGMPKDLEADYIDDYMDKDLTHEKNMMMLVLCFMTISILISALGLLAMSISYTEQQSKRIALCKVMGAETSGAVWELSKRFMALSLLAACFALPISVKAVQISLESFYNRIAFPWYLITAAVLATIAIAFVSIIGQTLKVARRNPIKSIRTE